MKKQLTNISQLLRNLEKLAKPRATCLSIWVSSVKLSRSRHIWIRCSVRAPWKSKTHMTIFEPVKSSTLNHFVKFTLRRISVKPFHGWRAISVKHFHGWRAISRYSPTTLATIVLDNTWKTILQYKQLSGQQLDSNPSEQQLDNNPSGQQTNWTTPETTTPQISRISL